MILKPEYVKVCTQRKNQKKKNHACQKPKACKIAEKLNKKQKGVRARTQDKRTIEQLRKVNELICQNLKASTSHN